MFFPERLPDLLFSHFFRNFTGKVRFWTPLAAQLGSKWRPKSPKWHQKCIQKTPGGIRMALLRPTGAPEAARGAQGIIFRDFAQISAPFALRFRRFRMKFEGFWHHFGHKNADSKLRLRICKLQNATSCNERRAPK